ncbi:ATP-binding cassette domain-containing protein, partial [Rhizobium ruizarguesonis]
MNMNASVSIKDLSLNFGAVSVLKDLNLDINDGEFLVLLGSSGCGKSTLLRAVADLLPPLDGRLSVLCRTASEARRRREVAFVFQDATLLPWRTVRENVALPLQVGKKSVSRSVDPRPDHWIELVGLSHLADRYPHQLSGGQR